MMTLDLHEARSAEMQRSVALRLQESEQRAVEYTNSIMLLQERMVELEMALEDAQWQRLTFNAENEFSRSGIERLVALSRVMYIKNPMIRRAVEVQCAYVWGLGVSFNAKHPLVQEVIDRFTSSRQNKVEMFEMTAYMGKEQELQVTGNLFFVFFSSPVTGQVTIRTIPIEEMVDIITNPEDRKDPWFFKRSYVKDGQTVDVLHPSINYTPVAKPKSRDGVRIAWDQPVYHVKTGGTQDMKFGMPEVYASLDWANAYKNFLEDWATIMRAYSRMAMKVSGLKGDRKIAAAKSQLNTSITSSGSIENNPSPTTAAWFFAGKGVEVSAIKTAGATTSAEEGRPLKLMTAAGVGIPDTFFGDANVGNFATAKTLDRPTELKFLTRQKMWAEVMSRIFEFVIQKDAEASSGMIKGATVKVEQDPVDKTRQVVTVILPNNDDKDWGKTGVPINQMVVAEFPSILERNVTDRVRAVVNAITLFGKQLSSIIPNKRLCAKWLLQALGEPNPDKLVMELYPEGTDVTIEDQEPATPAGTTPNGAEDPAQGGAVGDNG